MMRYNDDDAIKLLCIKPPQMIGYVKCFDSHKTMSFKVTNKKLLKSYTKILEKISNLMDIKIDCEPVYTNDDKYVKTKIKIYKDKVNTNLEGKRMPKGNAPYKCLSLIMVDSVIKASKKYYSQILLEEYKYEAKQSKMENLINDELESSLSDDKCDNETESDIESDNE